MATEYSFDWQQSLLPASSDGTFYGYPADLIELPGLVVSVRFDGSGGFFKPYLAILDDEDIRWQIVGIPPMYGGVPSKLQLNHRNKQGCAWQVYHPQFQKQFAPATWAGIAELLEYIIRHDRL